MFPSAGNPSPLPGFPLPFTTFRGNTSFAAPDQWTYNLEDPNQVTRGDVNPPFSIGQVSGTVALNLEERFLPDVDVVPAPYALTLVGVGIAGLGLVLRFRGLRAGLRGGRRSQTPPAP